jgi:hypothetical protein
VAANQSRAVDHNRLICWLILVQLLHTFETMEYSQFAEFQLADFASLSILPILTIAMMILAAGAEFAANTSKTANPCSWKGT